MADRIAVVLVAAKRIGLEPVPWLSYSQTYGTPFLSCEGRRSDMAAGPQRIRSGYSRRATPTAYAALGKGCESRRSRVAEAVMVVPFDMQEGLEIAVFSGIRQQSD